MAALGAVTAAQVRDAFAAMLDAGATIAVAGKLRRGLDERVRELAAPILRAGAVSAPRRAAVGRRRFFARPPRR
jgi:hypothetical protein